MFGTKFINNYARPFIVQRVYKAIEREIKDCGTLLDVGCGPSSPIKDFSKKFFKVGIDAYKPSIEKSRKAGIHDKHYCMNVLDISRKFKEKSFDCVLALDLIEHLTREDGLKLLDSMEKIAKKKIVVFTPNGFLPQGAVDGNPWQEHKSGWTVKEMKERGYKIIGIHGWKPLRGEEARIKFRPRRIWQMISDITEPIVRYKPELAFQILCIKTQK